VGVHERPVSDFDLATAVRASGPSSYDAHLHDGWRIGGAVNGGLLISLLGRAIRDTCKPAGHPDPLTISAYYLSPSGAGPATISTSVLRTGRTMSTAQASLFQAVDGAVPVERIRAIATYGDLARLPGEVTTSLERPALPPPERCVGTNTVPEPLRRNAPFLDRLDLRMDPEHARWTIGQPGRRGVIQGWLRLPDREPDPLSLLLAVDALPPVTFDYGIFGWVPTLELTAHVRAQPASGWLVVRHATRNFAGGMLEEDAEVWDSTGRLVAQSRQLARAPRG
jgi:hypothetical protein